MDLAHLHDVWALRCQTPWIERSLVVFRGETAGSAPHFVALAVWGSWAAGRCPCCGGSLDDGDELVIGEGVRICGRCRFLGHHRDGFDAEILLLITEGAREASRDRRVSR